MTDMISSRQMTPGNFMPFHPLTRPGLSTFYPFLPLPHMNVDSIHGIESFPVKTESFSPLSSPELSKQLLTGNILPSPPSPPSPSSKLEVCEKAAQILFMNSKWVKEFTTFQILPTKDQMTLFRHSWIKLFILGCAQSLTVEELENLKSEKISEPEMASFISAVKGQQSLRLSSVEHGYLHS